MNHRLLSLLRGACSVLILTMLLGLFPGLGHCETVMLDELDVSLAVSGWKETQRNKSVEGNPLSIAGQKYERGIGTHSEGYFAVNLGAGSVRFKAFVGVDDEVEATKGSVEFRVYGDKKLLWESGVMHSGDSAKAIDIEVKDMENLLLIVTNGGDDKWDDHADWVEAQFEVTGKRPEAMSRNNKPYILTPQCPRSPRITGPKVFGVRPGAPVLYTVSATGVKPIYYKAENLPKGLTLDPETGRMTGVVEKAGTYNVVLKVVNAYSDDVRRLKIVVGDAVCLTPPLGWNSWNCWAGAVDEGKIRAAAKAMVDSGLVDHGWTYINIDDCWMVAPGSDDPMVGGKHRDENGMILTNKKFPDMKGLCDYVHGLGLKIGIYSSPGPLTCAGYAGSYQFEDKDAQQFAEWGIDYLKYDWCSYDGVAKDDRSRAMMRKPYEVMRASLDKVNRDIVYSLCQYGMDRVPEWGAEVGGNCWRTTGDITDSWDSVSKIGFAQYEWQRYAGPGHWNDPDMLVVGQVGWGPTLRATRLTPDEQYSHISLWCLLCSPLLIGCDLAELDEFTLSLLTNDEVLEVNQDPLGRAAGRVAQNGETEVWAKDMEDGSKAVGLFNRSLFDGPVKAAWSDLGVEGKQNVRDLWRCKHLGEFEDGFETIVPSHGVVLIKVFPADK